MDWLVGLCRLLSANRFADGKRPRDVARMIRREVAALDLMTKAYPSSCSCIVKVVDVKEDDDYVYLVMVSKIWRCKRSYIFLNASKLSLVYACAHK